MLDYKQTVVFQHIPWIIYKSDVIKEDKRFDHIGMKWLDKLHNVCVRYIFCGDPNGGEKYKQLELVVTSVIDAQLGSDKSGFRIVQVFQHLIQHKYYSLDEVPPNNIFH